MVVLKDGSLITAMRASMSVQAAWRRSRSATANSSTADWSATCRSTSPLDGAEIIIAVNLGTPLLRPEQITSVLSVTGQMINILTEQNVRRSLRS